MRIIDNQCREGTTGRALSTMATGVAAADMTVARCVQACKSAGLSMAGIEYAQECCKY